MQMKNGNLWTRQFDSHDETYGPSPRHIRFSILFAAPFWMLFFRWVL
jgi:hypothetical protein